MLLLALGAVAATALGFAAGVSWLLPLLGAIAAYPVYLGELRGGRPGRAVSLMAWWAFLLSAAAVCATMVAPERAAEVIWKGPEYAAEMKGWIATGEGPEGSPSLYLPQHVFHFAVFSVACLVTGGLGGLYMGAALLNYMNFYVADLAMGASRPLLAASLGWPPWAVIRVAGFIMASVPLSYAGMRLLRPLRAPRACRYWKYCGWGVALVILDAVLKAVLAPHWRHLLLKTV